MSINKKITNLTNITKCTYSRCFLRIQTLPNFSTIFVWKYICIKVNLCHRVLKIKTYWILSTEYLCIEITYLNFFPLNLTLYNFNKSFSPLFFKYFLRHKIQPRGQARRVSGRCHSLDTWLSRGRAKQIYFHILAMSNSSNYDASVSTFFCIYAISVVCFCKIQKWTIMDTWKMRSIDRNKPSAHLLAAT